MADTVDRILSGHHLSGARLISLLERRDPRGIDLLKQLYPHTGKGFAVGVTGPPGAGKSTLIDRMITDLRSRDQRVGVLSVDPSSPYSGGALLGDRVRMQGHELDEGVFIRSMASRGRVGGVGKSANEALLVLDAMGHDVILIETVGVGQDEIDIAGVSHATVLVSIPGMGDDIQAMKAGLLEIGDIFVVNKADAPGADRLVQSLESMLKMRSRADKHWQPPVLKTVAVRNEGVGELVEACFDFRRRASDSGALARRISGNQARFFRQLATEMAAEKIFGGSAYSAAAADLEDAVINRALDPYSAAEKLLDKVLR